MITRFMVLVAATTCLVGCSAVAGLWPLSTQEQDTKPGPNAEQSPPPEDSRCQSIARQRAEDARANGYRMQIENDVFDEAYKDCMARHGGVSN